MKSTLIIETNTKEQINSLLQFLKQGGIQASVVYEDVAVSIVSEPSLGAAWNSEEDNRWDEIYGSKS